MEQVRTKQQVAFDGVRTAWTNDAFTHVLHTQVTTKFSMDGVVPIEKSIIERKVEKVSSPKIDPMKELRKTQETIGRIVGGMDGVRMPLGYTHA